MAGITITSDAFGKASNGRDVTKYTMTNSKGMIVKFINVGCAITELHVPDKDGKFADIVLGLDTVKGYETHDRFFGSIVGRVVGRIGKGEFTLDGKKYNLFINNGPNFAHGGKIGYYRKYFDAEVKGTDLVFTYIDKDGEEDFPGELTVNVTYRLGEDNTLTILYKATTTKPTPINLTNHSYFNLAGHDCGHLNDQVLIVHADHYLPCDENVLPTGEICTVDGSVYDLRKPVRLGDALPKVPGGLGFDNTYCLGKQGEMKLATRMEHALSGRYMECHTTQPGVGIYTAYYVDGITGKDGVYHDRLCAICMEAQNYPDAINQPSFPNSVLRPGETYDHTTIYSFGVL